MKTLHLLTLTLIALLAAPVASFAQSTSPEQPVVEQIIDQPIIDQPTATCNNPHTRFRNFSSVEIIIKAFNYKSSGCGNRFRFEDVHDVTLPPNFQVTYRDDLEGVEGCALTTFQVKFKLGINTYWSDFITPNGGPGVHCVDNVSWYTMDLTDDNLF